MNQEVLPIASKIVLAIATTISLIRWKNLKSKGLKWFPLYMLFCVAVETVVYLGGDLVRTLTYTVYDIVTYPFVSIYFYLVLNKDKRILFLAICYIIALSVSLITEDLSQSLHIQSVVGTIVTFLYTVIYFTSLLKSDKLLNFIRLPGFWIAVGLLIFNLGYLPITFSLSADILPSRTTVYTIVSLVAIFLYSCYTIAFLCKEEI
jgi:hypothetical protein